MHCASLEMGQSRLSHSFEYCCCSVDGHPLPIDELKGIKAVESIDLSSKGLEVASAIIIGVCIAGNEHLKELKCASNPNLAVVRWCRLSHIVLVWFTV